MDAHHEWQALADSWQQQAAPGIDFDAVRREAARRGRQLRRTLLLENSFSAVVVAICAWVALAPGAYFPPLVFGSIAVFLALYQAAMWWWRRGQLDDAGLDAAALVDLELRRCRTVRLYWRIGMWTALAMWLLLYAWLLHGWRHGGAAEALDSLAGGVIANVLVLPAMGVYGLWRCRDARRRQERLVALQAQLRAG